KGVAPVVRGERVHHPHFEPKRAQAFGQVQGVEKGATAEKDAARGLGLDQLENFANGSLGIGYEVRLTSGGAEFLSEAGHRIRTGTLVTDPAPWLDFRGHPGPVACVQRLPNSPQEGIA